MQNITEYNLIDKQNSECKNVNIFSVRNHNIKVRSRDYAKIYYINGKQLIKFYT